MSDAIPPFAVPFRESANRPHLVVGCEPLPIMAALVLCVITAFSLVSLWGIVLSIGMFTFLRTLLRDLAEKDPNFFAKHRENQRYNKQVIWLSKGSYPQYWRTVNA
jgi:type IV secretory pathway TrbD component